MTVQDKTDILRQNTAEIDEIQHTANELRYGVLAEAARIAADTDIPPVSLYTNTVSGDLCTKDFARFCRLYTEHLTSRDKTRLFLPESAKIAEDPEIFTVAYQKNPYSDRAFSAFAQCRKNVEPRTGTSFQSACEEVYYGRCAACILPIYSSTDGTLVSFLHMISKYDLKIDMVCDVGVQNEDGILRFVLLRHNLSLPYAGTVYIQINTVLPDNIQIGAFLSACESTGSTVTDLFTLPLTYTSDFSSYTIRFRTHASTLSPLLMFLQSVLESYSLEGIFPVIDSN